MSNQTKEGTVITIAIEAIKNFRFDELDASLKIMPLESLSAEMADRFVASLLNVCRESNNTKAAGWVLERWKVTFPEGDSLSLITHMFLNRFINISTLCFVVATRDDWTYLEVMEELVKADLSEEIMSVAANVEEVFGEQKASTYEQLRDLCIENPNPRLEEFLVEKLEKTLPPAQVPEYVKNYLSEYYEELKDSLPTEDELADIARQIEAGEISKESVEETIKSLSVEDGVEMILEGLKEQGVHLEEDVERAKEHFTGLLQNETMKSQILGPIVQQEQELDLETDRLLFLFYGPTNQLVGQDLTLDTPSAKYGGCRMFLCNLFDWDEDSGEYNDWFTGNCQQCLKPIKKRCYAVRMPGVSGGWEGCFCSFNCVEDSATEMETENGEANIVLRELISLFADKVQSIGIQDRD